MSRQSLLDKLALQHESQIQRTLAELESQIISDIAEHKSLLVSSDFTPEILRQKTAISIQLRNDFKKEFQTTFLAKSDSLIRDYDQAVSEFMKEFGELNIPDKFKNLTKVDLEIINALKTQSFQGFEEVANKYLTEINANVYQNVIAGRSFEDMVRDISGKLTGLEDVAGRPMSSHAGQLAHDSIMQFDAQFVKSKASSAGLDHFRYAGTAITTTREFCKDRIGRVYSEKQIRSIWSGTWAGKSSGDPFVVRGGYRCRHTWNPVDKDWDEKEEKKPEVKPKKKLTSRIKDKDVQVIQRGVVGKQIQNLLEKNGKDKRYPRDKDGKIFTRFRNSDSGITGLNSLDDETATKVFIILEELEDLAKTYNIPNIRSIRIIKRKKGGALMTMGDGQLYINPYYFNKIDNIPRLRDGFLGTGYAEIETKLAKKFKLGDTVGFERKYPKRAMTQAERKAVQSTWVRPFSIESYFVDELDKMRSIMYHEFGHAVHQLVKINLDDYLKYKSTYVTPIELKMTRISRKFGSSATRYSDANAKEWFAENFSLYHMDRKDLVDPKFIDFLENEVLK
jgi:hypothetical protein